MAINYNLINITKRGLRNEKNEVNEANEVNEPEVNEVAQERSSFKNEVTEVISFTSLKTKLTNLGKFFVGLVLLRGYRNE